MKRAVLLVLIYLLTLLLFWHTCDRFTPEQAGAAALLQAVLVLTAICALLKSPSSEVKHETE